MIAAGLLLLSSVPAFAQGNGNGNNDNNGKERNDGNEDALMLVIVGAGKPQLPTYPENSPMYGVKRD